MISRLLSWFFGDSLRHGSAYELGDPYGESMVDA